MYESQYLIEHGEASESERITRCVLGKVSNLSCQKYSSNVIEKILVCATPPVRGEIVNEIATSPDLHNLLHDKVVSAKHIDFQFANYVIQKALKLGNEEQRQQLLKAIRPYEEELSKSTGGRHILSQLNEITNPNSQNWSRMQGLQPLIPYCTMLNVSFFTVVCCLYDFLAIDGKIHQWDCILASFSMFVIRMPLFIRDMWHLMEEKDTGIKTGIGSVPILFIHHHLILFWIEFVCGLAVI